MAQPYSYAMVVERKSAGQSSAHPSECGGSEQCRDEAEDVECVQFSAGNPRVEHITGLVHLYRRQVSVPVDPQSPSSSSSALAAQVRAVRAVSTSIVSVGALYQTASTSFSTIQESLVYFIPNLSAMWHACRM